MIGKDVICKQSFTDWDGHKIENGADLGSLHRMGMTKQGMAYNTIKNGRVTAVITGDPYKVVREKQ